MRQVYLVNKIWVHMFYDEITLRVSSRMSMYIFFGMHCKFLICVHMFCACVSLFLYMFFCVNWFNMSAMSVMSV